MTSAPVANPVQFAGLDYEFPSVLWILKHEQLGKFGCYCFQGINGLAAFSTEALAIDFAKWVAELLLATQEVTFDEAREVAKGRPLPVIALFLCDDLDAVQIHYVK